MIQRITGVKQEREKGLSSWTGCPATMDRSHRHNDLEINLVETGSVTYIMSGRTVRLNAGQSMLFWAATPHQMIARDDTTLMHIVNLSPGWVVERQLPERREWLLERVPTLHARILSARVAHVNCATIFEGVLRRAWRHRVHVDQCQADT